MFLVGLESEDTAFLEQLKNALMNPIYPLYLGRRACPPELPLVLDIVSESLLTALREYPWLAAEWWRKKHPAALLRLTADAEAGESGGLQRDVPISFDPAGRQFGWRKIHDYAYLAAEPYVTAGVWQKIEVETMNVLLVNGEKV